MKTFEDWLNDDIGDEKKYKIIVEVINKVTKDWAIEYIKELSKRPKLSNLEVKIIEEDGKTLKKYFVDNNEIAEEGYFYKYNENLMLNKHYKRQINIVEWIKRNFNISEKDLKK